MILHGSGGARGGARERGGRTRELLREIGAELGAQRNAVRGLDGSHVDEPHGEPAEEPEATDDERALRRAMPGRTSGMEPQRRESEQHGKEAEGYAHEERDDAQ